MKRTFFIMLLATLVMQASAQQLTTKQILDRAAQIVGTKTGVSAKFSFISAQTGNISGDIKIKGSKYRTTFSDMTVWFDGKTQWAYMKATDEVNISTPNASQKARMNPYTFIYLYKKGYTYSHQQQGQNYLVKLKAQDKSSAMKNIELTIRRKDFVPTQIRFEQGGKLYTIKIEQFKREALNDRYFVFDRKQYPTAEIIDLR